MAPDRVQPRGGPCQFQVPAPDRVRVADITAIRTLQGWLYLAVVLDRFNRQVVGRALAEHLLTELPLSALEMALGRRQPPAGLIHHSDRGSQYASQRYCETLEGHGLLASMSRKGNCWDNALMERFFGSLKSEWLAGQRYLTRQQARNDIVYYIEMEYNSNRLHSTPGYVTPQEQYRTVAA